MATDKEADLLILMEVMSKELISIAMNCHEIRWAKRLEWKPSPEPDPLVRAYDVALKNAISRIDGVIHLARERTGEIAVA